MRDEESLNYVIKTQDRMHMLEWIYENTGEDHIIEALDRFFDHKEEF